MATNRRKPKTVQTPAPPEGGAASTTVLEGQTEPTVVPETDPEPELDDDVLAETDLPQAAPYTPDDEDVTAHVAKALLLEREERQRAEEERRRQEELSKYQFFIRCHVCNGHGVYVTRKPSGRPLRWDEWFSTYKPLSKAWFHEGILCQECYERGEETQLRLESVRTRNEIMFRITGNHARRFIGRVKKPKEITL